jgi:hypothetical protein
LPWAQQLPPSLASWWRIPVQLNVIIYYLLYMGRLLL